MATMASTAAPKCNFRWVFEGTIVASCIIDSADGLPVELMAFSVESEETAAEKSEPNPDA